MSAEEARLRESLDQANAIVADGIAAQQEATRAALDVAREGNRQRDQGYAELMDQRNAYADELDRRQDRIDALEPLIDALDTIAAIPIEPERGHALFAREVARAALARVRNPEPEYRPEPIQHPLGAKIVVGSEDRVSE